MIENIYNIMIHPFIEFQFLRHALFAGIGISLGCGLVGVILVLRRMTLVGDALSHAILPGIALSYLITGLNMASLAIGGIGAGLIVVCLSGLVSRRSMLHEEASLAGFYIISLAIGVILLSMTGGNMNVMHILFGNVLAVDNVGLYFIYLSGLATILTIIINYRVLVYECFDPTFVKIMNINGYRYHLIFLILVVINLVAACQALGTLMSLGIMILPAITARFWGGKVWHLLIISVLIALFSCYSGLTASYYYNWPSGPTIILICGILYVGSFSFYILKQKQI